MRSKPTAIDLFSGAGGLSRGLIDAGFRVVGAVEVNPIAAETYRANFPRVRLWEADIRKIPAARLRRQLRLDRGGLDLLAACPPCEGFSAMRTRNGKRRPRDERNDLVAELARFIRALGPKAVMVENVPRLAKDKRLSSLRAVLMSLGYRIRCEIIDAADYGVPQHRRRMILVASRLGSAPPLPGRQPRRTVEDAIGHLPAAGSSGDPLHDHGETRSAKVLARIRAIPGNGGSRSALGKRDQLECHRWTDGFKDVYGRMAWNRAAPTITGGCVNPSKGRFLHPQEHRSITLREAALLQTFPVHHHFPLDKGKFAVAEMIGDALPPSLVKLQADAIRAHLRESMLQRPRRAR